MRFLVDRCAGQVLSKWLREQGHDVLDARDLGRDPGDRALLERAAIESRTLVTIDTDFGELIYVSRAPHAGLVRLPDVPVDRRISLMAGIARSAPRSSRNKGDYHDTWRSRAYLLCLMAGASG